MRALTPARLAHAAQVSPLPLSRRPNILSPTTLWAPGIAFAVASACSVWSRDQGFAMSGQARRATPPKRVRYPTGCSFASGCSPPRLATTQLPSATCVTTSHRLDFHLPDKITSRIARGSPAYARKLKLNDINMLSIRSTLSCDRLRGSANGQVRSSIVLVLARAKGVRCQCAQVGSRNLSAGNTRLGLSDHAKATNPSRPSAN